MTPHERLLAQLEEIQHAHPHAIPCRGPKAHLWISERPAERLAAVEACGHCPAKAACGGYALAEQEPAGVWGGLTPKQRHQHTKIHTTPRRDAA